MERKWTKGPWRNAGTRYQTIVADADTGHDDPESVAAYGGHLVAESVTARNAHLIAAAPDLANYTKRKADEGCEEAQRLWRVANGEH